MTKKIKTLINFLDNYEWINIVSVIIMSLVSLFLVVTHPSTSFELMIIVGLVAILKGFLNFNIFLCLDAVDTHNKKGPISFIYVAVFSIIIGLLFILNIVSSPFTLLIISAIWMISDTIPYLLYAFKQKLGATYKHNPFLFSFSLIGITIIVHLLTGQISWITPEKTIAFFLILSCINLWLLIKEKKTV